jgi:hypothetical protein
MSTPKRPTEPRHGAQAPEDLPVHGPHPDDAWQELIAAYLVERRDMQAPDVFEVLARCELDEVMRARYLRLARGQAQ